MDIREAMAVLAYKVKEAKGNGRKVSKEAEEAAEVLREEDQNKSQQATWRLSQTVSVLAQLGGIILRGQLNQSSVNLQTTEK